jgi:hypothetical protein
MERRRISDGQGKFRYFSVQNHQLSAGSQEAPLPHSARSIIFLDKDTACFAYSPAEYAIFSIPTMTAVDIVTPLPAAGSGSAMNALTGLTGYMTLGLGAKATPAVACLGGAEVLIAKDGEFQSFILVVVS